MQTLSALRLKEIIYSFCYLLKRSNALYDLLIIQNLEFLNNDEKNKKEYRLLD